jgi:nicotinate-nucleotide pyrophosphorylase (carboxylating)
MLQAVGQVRAAVGTLPVVAGNVVTALGTRQLIEAGADIVLLDNMPAEQLAVGVEIRNRLRPEVILEASGGISPDTVRNIAASGIDRVSSGWPTHAAPWLDVALDWGAATRSA